MAIINYDPLDLHIFRHGKCVAITRRINRLGLGPWCGSPYGVDLLTPWERCSREHIVYRPIGCEEWISSLEKIFYKTEAAGFNKDMFSKIIKHKKQNDWRLTEVNLAQPVADYFTARGYQYAQEWFNIDFVFLKGEQIIAVELKKSLSKKVIQQAARAYFDAHLAYCAMPSKPRPESIERARKAGVGVMLVRPEGVEILLEAPVNEWMSKHYVARNLRLLKEAAAAGYLGQEIIAGRPNMAGEGPAQKCKIRVNEYLKKNPKATWKEIYTNVDNHYSSARSMQSALGKCRG
jgi:hypothetical protein